jgi:hypothetical protein
MVIESDFYATEAGRQHFKDQLTSIRYCVQETCNFDAIFAYLSSNNYDFRYDLSKGLRPRRSVRMAMAHEIAFYGIVQKDELGLDRAVEEVKHRMSRYQVVPNMLICAPQLLLYMATAPEAKIKYLEGGNLAVTRFEEGVKGYETRAFRDLGVFTSMPYEVSEENDSVQMLQRSTQVGEFYRMSPPPGWDKKNKLPPTYMDILIYDEESDQLKHITFEQAIRATGLGEEGTDYVTAADIGFDRSDLFWNECGEFSGKASTLPIDVDTLIKAVEAGAYVPICITIARPFIEHLMLSAIVTVAGRDTGATLFGPADMQVSANTSVKTIEGHYTCHTKSVITKPQNVYVMRDIMCAGYVAGGNTRFFGTEDGKAWLDKAVTKDEVHQAINRRLNWDYDDGESPPSMLAFLSPLSEASTAKRDQAISLTKRPLPWDVAGTATDGMPGGNDIYYKAFGLDQIHDGADTDAMQNQKFMSNGSTNNSICLVGPHRKFSPFAAQKFELVPGQGHFGPDAIPGVSAAIRCIIFAIRCMWFKMHLRTHLIDGLTFALSCVCVYCDRTRAGAAASQCHSRRHASPWFL